MSKRDPDDVAGADLPAAELEVVAGEAHERELDHGEVAQQLLDHPVDRLVVPGPDQRHRLGILGEQVGAEGEHARGGLVAAEEDAVGEPTQGDVVELVAVVGEQRADQPRPGVVALLLDRADQEVTRVAGRVERAGRAGAEVEPRHAQAVELGPVVHRKPEQLADHLERHREREVMHQVDVRAGRGQRVQAFGDDPLDQGFQPGQALLGELRGEVATQCRVARRVGHAQPTDLVLGVAALLGHELGEVVGEVLAGSEYRPRLVVPGHQPDAATEQLGQLADALGLAHPGQLGHRVQAVALERDPDRLGEETQLAQVETVAHGALEHPGGQALFHRGEEPHGVNLTRRRAERPIGNAPDQTTT